jgi:diguanylate cyclase (GGDEF)-like protein
LSFFVFAATLLTSLLVTWTSVNSIETFLRAKIDQKFPALLAQTAQRLELWYGQRELDLGVFSHSSILVQNLERAPRDAGARTEIEEYLRYVLERFPQYAALFVADRSGRPMLWVGEQTELPRDLMARVAAADAPAVSDVHTVGASRFQLATARIGDEGRARLGSLGALLRVEALEPLLASDEIGPLGEVFIVRSDGVRLTGAAAGTRFDPVTAAPDGAVGVRDYSDRSGEHVVGSAIQLARFSWTLAVEEPYEEAFSPVVSVIGRILTINLGIVMLFGIGALQVANSVVRPIEALSEGVRRISQGDRDVVIPETGTRDEVGLLTRTFNAMTERLRESTRELEQSRREVEDANRRLRAQNDELQRVNEVLEQLSITDGLTRLHNHRFFQDFLSREAKRADRSGQPLALILADLDCFKLLNDRLGHAGGDEVLLRVAGVMNAVIRETDLLARYGGEEFALVAPNTDLEGARQLAEKIRQAVGATDFVPQDDDLRVTVSLGVALYAGDRRQLFEDADDALYRAKDAGRDCVVAAGSETRSV